MTEPQPPQPTDPRDTALIMAALDMCQREEFDWAVVALQTAAEVVLEQQMARMLEWREIGSLGDVIGDKLVRTYRLDDGRCQALWAALTGDTPQKLKGEQPWWSDYVEHVQLRHEIVHRGATATAEEAERSLTAVLGMLAYIQSTSIRIGVDLGRMWEVGTEPRPRQTLPEHDR